MWKVLAYQAVDQIHIDAAVANKIGPSRFMVYSGEQEQMRQKFDTLRVSPAVLAADLLDQDQFVVQRFDRIVELFAKGVTQAEFLRIILLTIGGAQ